MRISMTSTSAAAAAAAAFLFGGGGTIHLRRCGVRAFVASSASRSSVARRTHDVTSRTRASSRAVTAAARGQMLMWGEGPSPSPSPSNLPKPSSSVAKTPNRRIATSFPDSAPSSKSGSASGGGGWDDYDDDGRRVRGGASNNRGSFRGGNNSSGTSQGKSGRRSGRGGWDDFDDDDGSVEDGFGNDYDQSSHRPTRRSGGRSNNRFDNRRGGDRFSDSRSGGRGGRGRGGGGRGEFGRGGSGRGRGRGRGDNNSAHQGNRKDLAGKINLRILEKAGYDHLFGLAPVLNALVANKREFAEPELSPIEGLLMDTEEDDNEMGRDMYNNDDDEWNLGSDDDAHVDSYGTKAPARSNKRKPEAQAKPYLFIQDNAGQGSSSNSSGRSNTKAQAAREIEALAKQRGVPIAYVDKGVLNVLSGNRPHQGYVLRCGKIEFESIAQLPFPSSSGSGDQTTASIWLALDEVSDPQNLGALLRSAHFLGGGGMQIGVLVCAKNSAPPSPTVSAASAGALELCNVYQVNNLPRTLKGAAEAGYRVLGAAAEAPAGLTDDDGSILECSDLEDVTPVHLGDGGSRPTVLVLGSEGHGLRSLVARSCTGFVRIPGIDAETGGDDSSSQAGVDSLNVSVTGGIMLWHLVRGA